MNSNENRGLRLNYVDKSLSELVLAQAHARLNRFWSEAPPVFPQRRWRSVASQQELIWAQAYALGRPLSDVQSAIRGAVDAYRQIFRLRGTEPPFPAYTVEVPHPSAAPIRPAADLLVPLHPPNAVDHTLTNSQCSYEAACLAFTVRMFDSAQEFALGAWDPPDAKWVHPRCEFCTPNDQNLAYGLREYCRGDTRAAAGFLANVRPFRGELRNTVDQAAMIRAIMNKNREDFSRALGKMLEWHGVEATKSKNSSRTSYFLCTTALGLSSLAVQKGILAIADLPQTDPFFPVQLLEPTSA